MYMYMYMYMYVYVLYPMYMQFILPKNALVHSVDSLFAMNCRQSLIDLGTGRVEACNMALD